MNSITLFPLLFAVAGLALSVCPLAAQPPTPPPAGPVSALHAHVCGFHFYRDHPARALRVHHYCSHVSSEVFQCVIYDSPAPHARLIGVEYIITEVLFVALSPEEKKLWHSHRYEVMSGLLTAPGATAAAEHALMAELVNTYGKTWHLWQVDRGDALPLGLPQLMMGFTADGQIDPALVAARDRDLAVSNAALRTARADLPARPIAAGADERPPAPSGPARYDLAQHPAGGATLPRGKSGLPSAPTRLAPGVPGETLSALTPAQRRGQELFFGQARCAACHTAPFPVVDALHAGRLLPPAATVKWLDLILETHLTAAEQTDLAAFLGVR